MEQIRVEYDDDADAVIEKVNDLLEDQGVAFVLKDDGLEHDGFNVYVVKRRDK